MPNRFETRRRLNIALVLVCAQVFFTSKTSTSFTTQIVFFDRDKHQFPLAVSGVADNCLLTVPTAALQSSSELSRLTPVCNFSQFPGCF